jgi:hypothetical protein
MAWGTVAGAIFVGLGALAAFWEIRRGARARETALLLDLSFRWLEKPMVESMRANRKENQDSLKSLISTDPLSKTDAKRWVELQLVPNFLEAIGYLERNRSAIRVSDVEGFWGSQIMYVWRLWEPAVRDDLRDERPTVLFNLEMLARKVRRYRERRLRRERLRKLLRAALPGLPRE